MGLFNKPKEEIELNFHCEKCETDFSRNLADCEKSVYPAFGNLEMTYYFSRCPDCDSRVSVRYS